MASLLIKTNLRNFLAIDKIAIVSSRLIKINKRDTITKNELEWIDENSVKLIEKAKSEKGVILNIDYKAPQLYYDKSEELKTADEKVKKILSLEFATAVDFKRFEEEMIKKEFQKNPLETDSLEIQIALHTMNIRRMANNIDEFRNKNRRVKFFLFRQIHRRDRLIAQLYYKDTKRYDWIIEKLNLKDYQLKESYPYRRVTKYEKFIQEVQNRAEEQRKSKLEAVKIEFEQEKKDFLKIREKELDLIMSEIKKLGFSNFKFPSYDKNKF